jgi:hypothetical protein
MRNNEHHYVGMSSAPFWPQGICQHGSKLGKAIDVDQYGWPPAMGRKCHLGKRIKYENLPGDCKKVVMQDYKEIWGIK